MPAVYDLANRGLLPPGFGLVGFARRDWDDQDFEREVHDADPEVRAHAVRRGGLAAAQGRHPVRAGRVRRRRRLRSAQDDPRGARPRPRHEWATTRSTCRSRRSRSRRSPSSCGAPDSPSSRTAMAAGRHREAVRLRPEDRARAQRRRRERVPARQRVPDRPLPRQGDGAEHPGAALRQPALRADLERQLRRPRADHHGRGHRGRRPGRLLRRHRRRARRHPEPPAAAVRPHRDGGAGVVRRRRPPCREGEGALGGVTGEPISRRSPPAASTRAAGRAASTCSDSSRKTG